MAELVAAVPELLRPEQAAQHYAEAVQTAVAACAEDTAGQRCYICLETVHPDTNEGLVRGCACRGDSGFAHVWCLARQAQVEVERDADTGWPRWDTCRQCEQKHHGVVAGALGWACWKTYVGRPEEDQTRLDAMSLLGNGLFAAKRHEEALSVREADLSMMRRLGESEYNLLIAQGNLAHTYENLGRLEEALLMRRDVYSGSLELDGEDHLNTLIAANNYAHCLVSLRRFEEAKSLLREVLPVARRVLGESNQVTLMMRNIYAGLLYLDPDATLDDLREAVATLEDAERIARRVFGGQHPFTVDTERGLRLSRAALRAREDAEPDVSAQELDAAEAAAASNRGDPAGAAADPNAELKAEIAALEAQLTEKRHELSRRTGTPQDQAPPPPTGSFSIGASPPRRRPSPSPRSRGGSGGTPSSGSG